MKKPPKITNIIKGAISRNGYTVRSLSTATGIPYQTLRLMRFNDPGSWRFYEWAAVLRYINFLPEELEEIRRELLK